MNEVIELEEKICRIQKDIADGQRNLRENERELKKWNDKLQTAQTVLKLNVKNKNHMKKVAEVVNLDEYQKIQEKIEEMLEEVKECNIQLSSIIKGRANLQSSVNLNTTLLSQSMQQLSTYGRILPLKAIDVQTT
jgi:chromosome segregation ATPase